MSHLLWSGAGTLDSREPPCLIHPSLYYSIIAYCYSVFQEPKLRATQYLPHIVKLQQSLYDHFNYRLDRKDAISMTIGQFLQQLSGEYVCVYGSMSLCLEYVYYCRKFYE